MLKACIAVVDAARARLFTFTRSQEVGGIEETFTEARDLTDPARRHRPSELFSESRPGSSRTGGLQYGFDDHRNAHLAELDAAFARTVAAELGQLATSTGASRLVICASPHMLGALRHAKLPDLPTDETPHALVELAPTELRRRLADYGFLPPPAA